MGLGPLLVVRVLREFAAGGANTSGLCTASLFIQFAAVAGLQFLVLPTDLGVGDDEPLLHLTDCRRRLLPHVLVDDLSG